MHRDVDSTRTLYVGTLSLNGGIAKLGWVVTLCREFADSSFKLGEFERWCKH